MEYNSYNIPKNLLEVKIVRNFNGYQIIAYPGPAVVKNGRAEHLPYHCHVIKNGDLWRIELSDKLVEMDDKKIPKDLSDYLIENKDELFKRVVNVFNTGNP